MNAIHYIIRRVLIIIPTLIGLTLLTFILMRAIPNRILESGYVNPNSNVPVYLQLQYASKLLGLNEPLPVQYFDFLVNLLRGNIGFMNTPFYSGPVLRGIEYFLPNTLQLALISVFLALLIALPLGTYMGINPGSVSDHVGRIFSVTGFAIPAFWLGIMLQIAFGHGVLSLPTSVFPISGTVSTSILPTVLPPWLEDYSTGQLLSSPTHVLMIDALLHGQPVIALNAFEHIVLPVATLTYGILAGILRFVRAGVVDSSRQEFVKSARAKGVPERVIVKKHIRRNALIPTVTVTALLIADLLGGVVLVETVFQYPGIGLLSVDSALYFQIYGVIGTTLVFGIIMVVANLLADIVYALMDPRIRY